MNKLKKNLILAGGVVLVILGLFHASFLLNPLWNSELSKVSNEMYSLVQMLNIGLITMLLALGVIFILLRNEMSASRLSNALLLAVSLFLASRLIAGLVLKSDTIAATIVFFVCTALYMIPAFIKRKDE